jgi:hypothetical protein
MDKKLTIDDYNEYMENINKVIKNIETQINGQCYN